MNKLFAILIMCSLSLPVLAIEGQEAETTPVDTNNQEVVATEEVNEPIQNPDDINTASIPETTPSPYKEPVSKKKLIKKFIIAMLCVAGTSIFLYGTLSIYNKLRDGLISQDIPEAEGEQPLQAPSDLTEAVKTFVEKTHWEN